VASILVRRIDEELKARLRVQAAQHGRSMEEEAREILKAGLTLERQKRPNLAESIRSRFAPLGGVDLMPPPREPARRPPKLVK
jgi:plasmid stability protein